VGVLGLLMGKLAVRSLLGMAMLAVELHSSLNLRSINRRMQQHHPPSQPQKLHQPQLIPSPQP